MTLRPEDIAIVKALEDVAIAELDQQFLNGEIEEGSTESAYFDAIGGEINGIPDWFKLFTKVIESYWDEHGR